MQPAISTEFNILLDRCVENDCSGLSAIGTYFSDTDSAGRHQLNLSVKYISKDLKLRRGGFYHRASVFIGAKD